MDVARVAKDYFVSSQSSLLIPNREYGSRKLINIGRAGSVEARSINVNTPSSAPPPEEAAPPPTQRPTSLGVIKDLLAVAGGDKNRPLSQRLKQQNMRAAANKQWQHPSESLLNGHILYTVKFLGECVVDQPKGTEVVKDAIRKMKFNKHLKRAEGQKPPKVELVISADNVTIIDPKTRLILHQYPLHRISYCADDKSDKRMFTFIAKEANGNKHYCYVFDSEKCAEEITLTIGQAFDLAYKRFLETSAPDGDIRKQFVLLQKKAQVLQSENDSLRKRVADLEKLKDAAQVDELKKKYQITDLQKVTSRKASVNEEYTSSHSSTDTETPRQTIVGRRLENLMLHEDVSQKPGLHINGAQSSPTTTGSTPLISPPPSVMRPGRASMTRSASTGSSTPATSNLDVNQFFGNSPPTSPLSVDPFGMEVFNPSSLNADQELMDIQAGFSRGLSIGTDDFSLDDLDPLNQK